MTTPAAALPAKPKDDKRRHFVREEIDAAKALGRVDVLLTHEAPKPFWIELPSSSTPSKRWRRDVGKAPIAELADALQPRLHCFGHHHVFASFTRSGIPTVCVDRINRSYLIVDADSFAWQTHPTGGMSTPAFLQAIDDRVLVCDGAMGTQLYSKGVFINRCFESLNLSNPDLVLSVHGEYLRAGADVVETNTFGANRIKLRAFGLSERVATINSEGARLARQAVREGAAHANGSGFVAGAIGPLGIRVEPWGKTGIDEAEQWFKEQAEALAAGGVDLFILETFRDLNEIGAAIAAVRSVCDLPIVAQMTTEEDGNSLDGTPPEQFAPVLLERGAAVVGVNCSVGPAPMLESIERLAAVTRRASPRSPTPESRAISRGGISTCARRNTWRRMRAVSLPTACASSAAAAARRRSISAKSPRPSGAARRRRRARQAGSIPVPGLLRRLRTRSRRFRGRRNRGSRPSWPIGEFVISAELMPPRGLACAEVIDDARRLAGRHVDVVTVLDGPRAGARMSALSLAVLVHQQAGVETLLQYSCRDKNLLGIQSDLLGAYAMGLRNLLGITGDVGKLGDIPDATAVFDVDSIGLTNVLTRLNHGLDVGGQPIGAPTAFHVGVMVNPAADDFEGELRRFEYKVDAGAEFAVTRPVFEVASVERFLERTAKFRIPLIAGLWPFESALNAEFMANEVPGVKVPDALLQRMRATASEETAAARGRAHCPGAGRGSSSHGAGPPRVCPGGPIGPGLADSGVPFCLTSAPKAGDSMDWTLV